MKETPETDAVAKQIGRLSMQFKLREIRAAQFAKLAQCELDKLAVIERQRDEALAQLTQARADDDRNNQLMVKLMGQRDQLLAALEESLALNINWADSTEPHNLEYFSEYRAVIAQARAAIAAVKGEK